MKFRNYCLVVMGDTFGVTIEIEKISETKPNILDAKGILISTFTSISTVIELNEWFRLNKRSFFLFELDPEISGYHIAKKDIHEGLFGFLKTSNIDDKTSELLRELRMTADTKSYSRAKSHTNNVKKTEKKITEKDIEKMTKKDKEDLWNKIVDNGVENMTEEDKVLLQLLSK